MTDQKTNRPQAAERLSALLHILEATANGHAPQVELSERDVEVAAMARELAMEDEAIALARNARQPKTPLRRRADG